MNREANLTFLIYIIQYIAILQKHLKQFNTKDDSVK